MFSYTLIAIYGACIIYVHDVYNMYNIGNVQDMICIRPYNMYIMRYLPEYFQETIMLNIN